MKKIALALVLVGFSYGAIAAEPCVKGVASPTTATDKFIKNVVTPRCSANTFVNFTETTTAIAVGSASEKGKKYFGGSSEGGAVTAKGDCAGTACAATDAAQGVLKANS